MKLIKCLAPIILGAAMVLCLAACGAGASGESENTSNATATEQEASSPVEQADVANADKHVIGVAVYDVADNEVDMFRHYLVDYISAVCFEDVQFVYSESISSEDDMLEFIDEVADLGGEGIMSFYNLDLQTEVDRCAEHSMYHIVASGTVSEEDFAAVKDNEYFLGQIGPMIQMEYTAGANMVTNFVAKQAGTRYFIMSGGASLGNEMHYQRTLGMLDTLKSTYGVDLGDTKELAASPEAVTLENEKISVTVSPGYMTSTEMRDAIVASFGDGSSYDIVLSTLPVEPVMDMLDSADVEIAQVDCYSQDNQLMFASGKLDYLVGKYGSVVGPSFVAMYNAITGHPEVVRDGGKAFQIVQNFWSSDSAKDFDEKFEYSSNMVTPAYNYEDLYSICYEYNPDVTYEDFEALAQKCSYEDVQARRTQG